MHLFEEIILILGAESNHCKMDKKDVNRLKVVLAEKKRTNKWLAQQLEVNPATVSKWCTNSAQPDIQTFIRIASLLGVEVEDLFNKEYIEQIKQQEK
jgi:DNA-binding XRE family transcriptional regulator